MEVREMSLRSVLVIAVVVCTLSAIAHAEVYWLGDDDGFDTQKPVVPGDEISIDTLKLEGDGDGTDEVVDSLTLKKDFVFTGVTVPETTAVCSLFVQYIDWPESADGYLWINGIKTSFRFPRLRKWDDDPWTVRGVTINLMPYIDLLREENDGTVTFNFLGEDTDAYVVDYATLTIETEAAPPTRPGKRK
jgi:hypothetical protein